MDGVLIPPELIPIRIGGVAGEKMKLQLAFERLDVSGDNLGPMGWMTERLHVAPLSPPAKHGGRKRNVDCREIVNGIMYVLSTGCQWREVPKDLPPKSTLYDYLDLWAYDGTLENIHHAPYVKRREQIGREASPAAGVIDSRSVKSAEPFGNSPRIEGI